MKQEDSATYDGKSGITSHGTRWFTDNCNGGKHMILVVPEGIVIGYINFGRTTLEFVSNGQLHTVRWDREINQRTLVTIAKSFAKSKANPLLGQADGLLPCPICGEKPSSTEYNGGFIIRCGKDHAQIGTGTWMREMDAIVAWNELSQHCEFVDDGTELLPCPFCGKTPHLDPWGRLTSCLCTLRYIFGGGGYSVEEWNDSIRAGLARRRGGAAAHSLPQLPASAG